MEAREATQPRNSAKQARQRARCKLVGMDETQPTHTLKTQHISIQTRHILGISDGQTQSIYVHRILLLELHSSAYTPSIDQFAKTKQSLPLPTTPPMQSLNVFTKSTEHKIYAPSVRGAQPAGRTWRIASPLQYSASIPSWKRVTGTKWRVVGEIEVWGLSSNMNGCRMRLEMRSQQAIHAWKAGPYLFLGTRPQCPSRLREVSSSAPQNLREFTCLGSCCLRPPVPPSPS
ncbi:hypothetical protein B0H10DRAFT_1957742 [Mycena sp. CBHHK59/15]|nr:hypothetical protein B0H10DRAFT_1957742 [Mycena sp. CBHHK59/15]